MKNLTGLLLLISFLTTSAYAQNNAGSEAYASMDSKSPFSMEDGGYKKASFPGGFKALSEYLAENFQYTDLDRENGFEGTIIIRCNLDERGLASDCEVIKSIHPLIDTRALASVKNMPEWIPAQQDGIPVASRIDIPFNLKLK